MPIIPSLRIYRLLATYISPRFLYTERAMKLQSLFILGRQPAIGCAELESLYGATTLERVNTAVMGCSLPITEIDFARLGGSIKLAEVLEEIASTDWHAIQRAAAHAVHTIAHDLDEGKIQLGLSAYGIKISPAKLNAAGLELKKALRKTGRSVRLIPNQDLALNSAQVVHNHLTGPRGVELVFVQQDKHILLARTIEEQDITAYAARDQGRPKRDAFVGMLPPKLAQTIINLATDHITNDAKNTVLDPFCGTGVILQEALLMGFNVYGTDVQTRMVDYSTKNICWIREQYPGMEGASALHAGDATTWKWEEAPIDAVACETYLGRPLSSIPSDEKLRDIVGTCNLIIEKFLKNLSTQIKSGTRLCLAIPAWKQANGHFAHLPLLDHLTNLGYNRVSFVQSDTSELMYFRPDQIVARELLVITRK